MAQAMQPLTWTIQQNPNNITLRLAGELSRYTLSALYSEVQQRNALFSAPDIAQKQIDWDVENLTHIDSAGFALLCDLLYRSEAKSAAVRLINVPEQFTTLADLFGLADWVNHFSA